MDSPFFCTECGENVFKFCGKCPNCGEFGTIRESRLPKPSGEKKIRAGKNLADEELENVEKSLEKTRLSTRISEVDRVLGGGFFSGSAVLFGGHPGIGKSTLALQIFLRISDSFYFSGEESRDQIASRASRIDDSKNTQNEISSRIFATHSIEDIIETISKLAPKLAIIDSIQMVGLENASFGTTAQIRENAEILVRAAKKTGTAILIIGHVTKNDELAGPKILEHLVDAVLYLDGEAHSEMRILRSIKNRFGSTLEIGIFEMRENGLAEVINPSEFFLASRPEKSSGSAISAVREGGRNFLLELQVLTTKTNFGQPRRTASGVSLSKFHLLCAVISKFSPFKMDNFDAYLNVVGGFKVVDPAADAAIAASIASSRAEKDIPASTAIFGEVGLSGEIRPVSQFGSRVQECAKLGFKKIICPPLPPKFSAPETIELKPVRNIAELLREIF